MGPGVQSRPVAATETESSRMSLYSTIDRRINADSWFRGLSHAAQLLWFRLLTGPHVTQVAGLWPANEDGLARAFGYTLEGFREGFAELSKEPSRKGFPRVMADWSAGVIWVPNALEFPANQPTNENVLKGWIPQLELVPECSLKTQALRHFTQWVKGNRKRFPKGLPEGFPKGLPEGSWQVSPQEQEQEQEGGRAGSREDPAPATDSKSDPEEFSPPATRPHIRAYERALQGGVEFWHGWTEDQSARLVACGKDPVAVEAKFRAHNKSRGVRSSDWEAECEKWVIDDEQRSKAAPTSGSSVQPEVIIE